MSEPFVVEGGRLWASVMPPQLHAPPQLKVFSIATGQLLWSQSPDPPYDNLTNPALADGLAVVGASNPLHSEGRVLALDQATGRVKWKSDKLGFVADRPAARDGRVYVGSHDGKLHVLDLKTGKELWSFPTEGPVYKTPAFTHDLVIFGSGDKYVRGVRASDGKLVWTQVTQGEVASRSVVSGDVVFVGSMDGKLYALDGAKGTVRWTHETDGYVDNPSVDSGVVYVGTMAGEVLAIDAETGKRQWRFVDTCERCNEMYGFANVDVAEGLVVASSRTGVLFALGRADGKEKWRFERKERGWPDAVISGASVYVEENRKAIRLDLMTGKPLPAAAGGR